jgi:hypothetical protein
MSFDRDEKVDIIDLLISLLRDHEKKLDEISYRLEKIVGGRQPQESMEIPEPTHTTAPPQVYTTGIVAFVSNWQDFRARCNRSNLVSVSVSEAEFKVSAYSGGVLYYYSERLPSIQVKRTDEGGSLMDLADIADAQVALSGKLRCGLALKTSSFESKVEGSTVQVVRYSVDRGIAKEWVASQLDVEESSIIEGELDIPRS